MSQKPAGKCSAKTLTSEPFPPAHFMNGFAILGFLLFSLSVIFSIFVNQRWWGGFSEVDFLDC